MDIGTNTDDLPKSLIQTLADSELPDVASDLAETSLDTLIEDGIFRDIPIIGTLVGVWRSGATVRDALFLRKLTTFLKDLSKIPTDERRDVIQSLSDPATQENIGEKLIGLLDRFESTAKARLLGRSFARYAERFITSEEFWRVSFIIDRLPMSDISAIVDWQSTDANQINHVRKHLYVSVGLAWFVLNVSSTGFAWNERLCEILSDIVSSDA
jgi:hypothetical protein